MRSFALLLAIALLLSSLAGPAWAFRCGKYANKLATEGMHKFQILADCGEPVSKEVVGYEKNRFIEEWLYIIEDGIDRHMYLLRFDDKGVAIKIEWLGKAD